MGEDIRGNFCEAVGNASVNAVDYSYLQVFFSRLNLSPGATIIDVEAIVKKRGFDNLESLYKFLIANPE